ncbi:MAG: GNAT family N-acetyltransferase [FCB group bacterium]|jgi:predicted acetyltransferase|nr:GNAT family N-acetyltransferase [FCB group bacterium]
MIKLEAASLIPPAGLLEMLTELGGGENGFGGTSVPSGRATLEEYLRQCVEMPDPEKLAPGLVPQTIFWVLGDEGIAVGMVRMRHCLNDSLRIHGGHIGYFIRRDWRGKGYATEALQLALEELRMLGEPRALLTTTPDNARSIRVIERNGGRFEDAVTDPQSGKVINRYWIEL